MRSLFTAAINQPLDTLVDSATITLSGIGTGVAITLLSGTGVSVYKNGASISSATVSDGDRIRMRIRTSTAYNTPTFGLIKIGSEETLFTVVTIPDATSSVVTEFQDILPIDLTKNTDGSNWSPNSADNALTVYSGSTLLKKTLLSANLPANVNASTDRIAIATYHGNGVVFLNANTYEVEARVTGYSKAYGVAVTATNNGNETGLTWVTESGSNTIASIGSTNAFLQRITVGTRPLGISAAPDKKTLWVANNGSDSVSLITLVSNWSLSRTIQLDAGAKPLEVVADDNSNAWVSCHGNDSIYYVRKDGTFTKYASLAGVRGIAIDSAGSLWVACSKAQALVKHDASGAIVASFPTDYIPWSVAVTSDGVIHVSSFGSSRIQSFSSDGTVVNNFIVDKYPYGLAAHGNNLVVANLYSNTPNYLATKDNTATQFDLADVSEIERSSKITTNTFVLSGIDANSTVPVAVPDLYGARIIKNGIATNLAATTAKNGDVLSFSFTAPSTYDTPIELPLFVGNVYEYFKTRTAIEDGTPDVFTLTNVFDANLDADYVSNTVTITGITSGITVPFSISSGKIILNGIEQSALTVNVKLNDTIAIKVRSSTLEKTSTYVTVLSGKTQTFSNGKVALPNKNIWRVTTKALIDQLWIKPQYKGTVEYVPEIAASGITGKYVAKIPLANISNVSYIPLSDTVKTFASNLELAPSYFDSSLYQYEVDTNQFQLLRHNDLDKPVSVLAQRYAVYAESNEVHDLLTNQRVALNSRPRYAALSPNSKIYITLESGQIAVYDVALSQIIEYIEGNGNLLGVIADATGCWVYNATINSLVHYVAGSSSASDKTIANVNDVWSMALTSTHLWTADAYDNTISKFDLITLQRTIIAVDSVPNYIALDAQGSVWVTHYASRKVMRFNANTNVKEFEFELSYATASFLHVDGTNVYVGQFYSNIVNSQNRVQKLTGLYAKFEDSFDNALSTMVASNKVTISGLIRPIAVSIEPNNDYDLYVNDVKITAAETKVYNDDVIYLNVLSSKNYYEERVVTLNDYKTSNTFKVVTETNVKPDPVIFAEIFDARPRWTVTSNEVVIKGMTPGQFTTLRLNVKGWRIAVNGVFAAVDAAPLVTNGDVVKLEGPVRGVYGETRSYVLSAGKAYPVVVGTQIIHNLVLSGVIIRESTFYYLSTESQWIDFHRPRQETAIVLDFDPKNFDVVSRSQLTFDAREAQVRASNLVSVDASHAELRDRSTLTVELPEVLLRDPTDRIDFETQFELNSGNQGAVEFMLEEEPHLTAELRSSNYLSSEVTVEFELNSASEDRTCDAQFELSCQGHKPSAELSQFELRKFEANNFESLGAQLLEPTNVNEIDSLTAFLDSDREIRYIEIEPVEFETFSRSESKEVSTVFALTQQQSSVREWIALQPELSTAPTPRLADYEPFDLASPSVRFFEGREAIKVDSAQTFEIETFFTANDRVVHQIDNAITFEKNSVEKYEANAVEFERDYRVYGYEYDETVEEEGAYSNAEDAIAAGVAAGYTDAYAVEFERGRFMWATNKARIEPPTNLTIPELWYVHGG